MLLARAAERSLDVQYYIWKDDLCGRLLFGALREAAERGVRVRLLLEDNNSAGLDPTLAALDAHPNIEVRLFNPFVNRGVRWLGYLTDFSRLNRRMHNKSFTADNQATIIGGRNVGDEAQEVEQLADLMLELLGMPHTPLPVEHVPIAAADTLALEIAGVDEVVDDALGRSLGDADRGRDVPHADIGISLNGQQHLRVAREEVPRTAFYFRT